MFKCLNGKSKLIFFIIFLFGFSLSLSAQLNNPISDPKAVVIKNDVRFTILTPQLIRMEWAGNKRFEDNASFIFINRDLPVPSFQTKEEDGWLIIQTEKILLKYLINSGPFSQNNLRIQFEINDSTKTWHPGIKDTANLFGTIRTLDAINGSTPLEPGILSRDGWALIDDSESPLFDNSDWNWVKSRPKGKRQDWYFFGYGHDYKKQLFDFTQVAGKIPLPPKFAFGTWWSRYWNYTDEELMELISQFKTFDIPLDVLVVDMDWHNTQEGKWDWGKLDSAGLSLGWTGYSWNKNYFPDPQAFLDWTEKENLKVTLNLHPASGIQPFEDQYDKMAHTMGIDPHTKKYIPFDITDKIFARNYFNIVIHPFEEIGVDFWWLDWQQWHTTEIPGVTPTWWINYVFFTDMEREGKRPILFHRWGGLGNHRYQIGFSGDAYSTWESLAFQPYFTTTASNVGFGYWSHDIGGHMPGPVTAELYTRWVQFGAFSPILRTHASKNSEAERRIWGYPFEYFKVMREAFLLRRSLIPYIYTAAREAYDTGISLCRPMYYDYPNKNEAYNFKSQYMFGNDILAAPIAAPVDSTNLLANKKVWLPEGEWYEWLTGTVLQGSGIIERNFLLDEIPAYIKSGSVIPMQVENDNIEASANPLVITVFPGDSGSTKIYEDAGNSLEYKGDQYAWTAVRHYKKNEKQLIEIFPVQGSFEGMLSKRAYKIVLPGVLPPQNIYCNGKELSYEYDGNKLTASFITNELSVNEKVSIFVIHSAQNLYDIINGFPGKLSRIKHVRDLINSQGFMWNVSAVVYASQTGRRISLNPNEAFNELKEFQNSILEIKKNISTYELLPEVEKKCLNIIEEIAGTN